MNNQVSLTRIKFAKNEDKGIKIKLRNANNIVNLKF